MNKVKCQACGYEWESNSKLQYVSCPSCLQKTKNEASNAKTMKAHPTQK